MRNSQRENTLSVRTSLSGIASVVICIMAFLFVMAIVVIAVRFVVG
ncbi:MAG: hypothetical protein IJ131_00235 [Eggerthellaceae bacterium]|nr:hypothetical protein [Eggerthellaceae bacterium]